MPIYRFPKDSQSKNILKLKLYVLSKLLACEARNGMELNFFTFFKMHGFSRERQKIPSQIFRYV